MPSRVEPLFVKEQDVARMLCCDVRWLHSNSKHLEETTGFPKKDPVLGKRHYESIVEWARERNLKQLRRAVGQLDSNSNKENIDAF